jgi:hypothetical protein
VKLELKLRYIQFQQMMRVSSYFHIVANFFFHFYYICTANDHGVNALLIISDNFLYSYSFG